MSKPKLNQLRIKLDQLTERIISRLVDRSRFMLNPNVYLKDGIFIKNRSGISFLEFAIEGLENYHSLLGRYDFPDQNPMIIVPLESPAERISIESPISKVKIDIANDIIKFYMNSLKEFCAPREDQATYGETVYCDADIIQLLNERINLGRYVAEAKLQSGVFKEKFKSKKSLENQLRDLKREKELMEKVQKISLKYGFDVALAKKYFRWIVGETLKVEVNYLKKSQPEIFFSKAK
jgi:monofunctional chorismate mutase